MGHINGLGLGWPERVPSRSLENRQEVRSGCLASQPRPEGWTQVSCLLEPTSIGGLRHPLLTPPRFLLGSGHCLLLSPTGPGMGAALLSRPEELHYFS